MNMADNVCCPLRSVVPGGGVYVKMPGTVALVVGSVAVALSSVEPRNRLRSHPEDAAR